MVGARDREAVADGRGYANGSSRERSRCSGDTSQTVVVAGGHRLTTDQPGGVGGEDLGSSPHELFPAALAACTVWALVSYVAAACPLRRSIENGFTFDERIELAARAA